MSVAPQPVRPPSGGRTASPAIVFALNLLLAGCAGYFLLRQKQKAWTALAVFVVLVLTGLFFAPPLLTLFTAIDAYLQAQQREAGFAIGQWTWFRQHAA